MTELTPSLFAKVIEIGAIIYIGVYILGGIAMAHRYEGLAK